MAGIAAAPFTGGASLLTTLGLGAKTAGLIGAGAGVAGQLAGGAAKQRSEDRGAQGDYDLMRTQTQNRAELEAALARMKADGTRRGQLVGLDMMKNYQPSTDPRAQKFSGGSTTPRIDPETQQLLRDRTMQALQSGSDVPPVQTMPAEAGGGGTGMDTFLNALNLGSTALGGLQQAGLLGGGGSTPQPGQTGGVTMPPVQVGQVPEDERPWWLKQDPARMPYDYGKVNL